VEFLFAPKMMPVVSAPVANWQPLINGLNHNYDLDLVRNSAERQNKNQNAAVGQFWLGRF
jgi:hypothetical protein